MEQAGLVRSDAQRLDALFRANTVRAWRATAKRRMRHRDLTASEVLRSSPPEAHTMKVGDLLQAVPGIGRVKANRILRLAGIAPSKTVLGITDRQRIAVLRALNGR